MEKSENSPNFKESFNIDFEGIKEEPPKSNKKKILIYAVTISLTVALVTTTILLVGYYKFNWFKSDEQNDIEKLDNDQYDIDIKIKSFANQVDYFTEKKTIKSTVIYTSGDSEESEQIIDTNFVVILTDRKKLEKNEKKKRSFINNATLIILDSKIKIGEEETNLSSFNIFDEKQITEFENNPNGTIYPMAQFSYFQNGTIIDVNLPEDMDKYNAQSLLDLIDNVIPRLSRRKRDDKKNGLKVKRRRTKRGDILTETQDEKEYSDKYTRSRYKGSKYKKKRELDIQNEKIKKVSTTTNLVLETQKEDEETFDFGLQNFTYEITSEITSTKNEEEKKEEVQLVKRLAKKIKFIKSDDLMESLVLKEQEEEDKENEENEENEGIEENQENQENEGYNDVELRNSKQLRNLAWEGSFSKSWTLASSNILGKTVSLKYTISLSSGKLTNKITASCDSISISYGNTGTSTNKNEPSKSTGDKTIFTIPFPGTPVPVKFKFKIGGSLGYNVKYDTSALKFTVSLTGTLYAKAEVVAGVKGVAEVSVGAQGTIVSITSSSSLTKKSSTYTSSNSISISGGEISVYAKGKLLNKEVFTITKKCLKGWSKKLT